MEIRPSRTAASPAVGDVRGRGGGRGLGLLHPILGRGAGLSAQRRRPTPTTAGRHSRSATFEMMVLFAVAAGFSHCWRPAACHSFTIRCSRPREFRARLPRPFHPVHRVDRSALRAGDDPSPGCSNGSAPSALSRCGLEPRIARLAVVGLTLALLAGCDNMANQPKRIPMNFPTASKRSGRSHRRRTPSLATTRSTAIAAPGDAGVARAGRAALRHLLLALSRPNRRRRRHDRRSVDSRSRLPTTSIGFGGAEPAFLRRDHEWLRRMYPYADRVEPADRWAIVAYIRALQASASATTRRCAGQKSARRSNETKRRDDRASMCGVAGRPRRRRVRDRRRIDQRRFSAPGCAAYCSGSACRSAGVDAGPGA